MRYEYDWRALSRYGLEPKMFKRYHLARLFWATLALDTSAGLFFACSIAGNSVMTHDLQGTFFFPPLPPIFFFARHSMTYYSTVMQ